MTPVSSTLNKAWALSPHNTQLQHCLSRKCVHHHRVVIITESASQNKIQQHNYWRIRWSFRAHVDCPLDDELWSWWAGRRGTQSNSFRSGIFGSEKQFKVTNSLLLCCSTSEDARWWSWRQEVMFSTRAGHSYLQRERYEYGFWQGFGQVGTLKEVVTMWERERELRIILIFKIQSFAT